MKRHLLLDTSVILMISLIISAEQKGIPFDGKENTKPGKTRTETEV